jgi:hypothetical protein
MGRVRRTRRSKPQQLSTSGNCAAINWALPIPWPATPLGPKLPLKWHDSCTRWGRRLQTGARGERTHLAVTDEQQHRLCDQPQHAFNCGHVQRVIRLVASHHPGRHRQPQRVQGGDHDSDLPQFGGILAMAKLEPLTCRIRAASVVDPESLAGPLVASSPTAAENRQFVLWLS